MTCPDCKGEITATELDGRIVVVCKCKTQYKIKASEYRSERRKRATGIA